MTTRRRVERYELVIIGGGQAGLAAGYWLAQHDIDFVILDANARTGDAWRGRWDSLRLFTPAKHDGLPGLAFPGDPDRMPGKDQAADYLEWYARVFDLPVRHGVRVTALRRPDQLFEIETDGNAFEADNVIVATGPFHAPRIPAPSSRMDSDVMQLHSSAYRNPAQLPDGPVVVVGAANSGAQIAMELAASRRTYLAGRSVGSLPRRLLGRDLFDWLYATAMRPGSDSLIGRHIRRHVLGSADPLIGMRERDLARAGVLRVGRVEGASAGMPALATGAALEVRTIVWATGYRPDFRWIQLPVLGDDGLPVHDRGVSVAQPGLFFLGLRFQHRLSSALIGGVGADAERIARSVMGRYGESRSFAVPSHFAARASAM